jgi:hypothetical protein
LWVESATGEPLGAVTPLDYKANNNRHRCRAQEVEATTQANQKRFNAVELAYQRYYDRAPEVN